MNTHESDDSRSLLERFLGLFADVRGGEGGTVLLLALNIFLVLLAYYIIKVVREPLIVAGGGFKLGSAILGGAEKKSFTAAGQSILLLGAVPLYAMLAARFSRRRLINMVTFFFVACLVGFYILAYFKVPLGVIFYLWVGIFNVMVIAQFWSFANDLYTPGAGKRLFAIVAFGASSGAVFGSFIAGRLIAPLGIYQLLPVAAGVLVLSLLITNVVDSRERHRPADRVPVHTSEAEKPMSKGGAYRLVFGNKYLLMIALLMLFLNWVNTTGEYILDRTLKDKAAQDLLKPIARELWEKEHREALAADTVGKFSETEFKEKWEEEYREKYGEEPTTPAAQELWEKEREEALAVDTAGKSSEQEFKKAWERNYEEEFIGTFRASFYFVVNLVTLLVQLFLVSRILKYLGVRTALLVLPVIALGGYALLVLYPVLKVVRWAKTAENATDYSLQNTVRHVLFLPLTREEKYKAKQATDTLFVRVGDLLSALLVLVGAGMLAFQTKHFAMVNLALVVIWIIFAILIGLENRRLTASSEQ